MATGHTGPLSEKYRSKHGLYSPSELQQIQAKESNSNSSPQFVQDNRTTQERNENNTKWRKHYNDVETSKEALKNHENLGSPHTAKRVVEGVAHGMVDMATGAALGKIFQGAKALMAAQKAENTVVVIGEGMGRVQSARNALIENGTKNVEVFKPSKDAMTEWDALTAGGKHIDDDVVKGTMLYKENVNWIQKAIQSGKTILDIGNDGRSIESTFYRMEKQTVYGN